MKDTPQSLLEDVKNNLPLLYDVEEDYKVSLLKYSENIIYKVEFSKSSPVVFRIHRPGYHDIEELEGEIRWMDEIHKDTQVRLPVVYRGRDGGFLQKMRTSGGETVYCSVISFLYGSPLGELKGEALLDGLEKLGEITARLHIQSINRDKSVKIKRFCWDINNLFGDNGDGIWGSWRDYEGITGHDYRILEKCTENIKKELNHYGRSNDRYGLIHADLHFYNVISYEGNDQIIDSGMQQFAFHTGRCHQSKDHGYTARTDTDRKRDGIKYLLLDVFPSEAVYILTGFFFIRRTRIAQQLHCRFTNQHSTSQLNNRNSQTENQ